MKWLGSDSGKRVEVGHFPSAKSQGKDMLTLDELRANMPEAHMGWQAGEGFVSTISDDEFRSMLGAGPGVQDGTRLVAANQAALSFVPRQLPRRVDWREKDGQNWMTSVKMQGACGSCSAFAVAAAIEARARITLGAGETLDLAEADLFFGCGGKCNPGIAVEVIMERAKSRGVGLETDFPYTPGDQPPRDIRATHRISDLHQLQGHAQRKQALFEDGPLVARMQVFEDFRFYKEGVYEHLKGDLAGHHAVCVIGYDDDENCWIAKNSWSERHGEGGYFRIKYGQCCIDDVNPFFGFSVEAV